jgi:hypothetical protein
LDNIGQSSFFFRQADVDFEDLESVLNTQGHVLTPEAKAQAAAAIQHVRGGKPPLDPRYRKGRLRLKMAISFVGLPWFTL